MPSEPTPIITIFRENCLEHHFSSLNPRLLQNGKNIRKTIFFHSVQNFFFQGKQHEIYRFRFRDTFRSELQTLCDLLLRIFLSRVKRTFFLPRCWCHSSKLFYNFLLFCLCSVAIKMLRGLAPLPLALHSPKASRKKRENVLISFLSSC